MAKQKQLAERRFLLDPEKTKEITAVRGNIVYLAGELGQARQSVSAWLKGAVGIKETYLHELARITGTANPRELLSEESRLHLAKLPPSDHWR